jgi:putative SOS response-associated peptidase YedK
MCGRYNLSENPRRLADYMGLADVPQLAPRYNVAPSQSVAVVGLKSGGTAGGLALMRWGPIPHWASDDRGPKPKNAKSDTVLDKPIFRESFHSRRCLIPASGFYEWSRKGPKRPYHIRRRDGAPIALAGLWDRWTGPDGSLLTCAILTTSANEVVKPLHDRMPVILEPDDFGRWLDPATPVETLTPLLRPCAADVLEAVPVVPAVNNPKNDGPECLGPVA